MYHRDASVSSDDEQEKAELPAKNFESSDSDPGVDPDPEDNILPKAGPSDKEVPFQYDFDLMMQRTKEENRKLHNKRRRGTKDIEMINDNDDAIARLLADMRLAAHEDRELNLKGEAATKKLGMIRLFSFSSRDRTSSLQQIIKYTDIGKSLTAESEIPISVLVWQKKYINRFIQTAFTHPHV